MAIEKESGRKRRGITRTRERSVSGNSTISMESYLKRLREVDGGKGKREEEAFKKNKLTKRSPEKKKRVMEKMKELMIELKEMKEKVVKV